MTDECELCGRDSDEAEKMHDHQGFKKCHRCYKEYQTGAGATQESDQDGRAVKETSEYDESKDWKEQAIAS